MEQRLTFNQVASVYGGAQALSVEMAANGVQPCEFLEDAVGSPDGAKREALLAGIAAAISDHGGEFAVDYETHLDIARRI
jgi:hypothetical protein